MDKRFKRVICGTMPAMLLAGAGGKTVGADEVQSIIGQAAQQISRPLPAQTPPPPIPQGFQAFESIAGRRG